MFRETWGFFPRHTRAVGRSNLAIWDHLRYFTTNDRDLAHNLTSDRCLLTPER